MSFQVLAGVAAAVWLASIAVCVLAFVWGQRAMPHRFWGAVGLSLLALLIGMVGMTRVHLEASKTVNGRIQWHYDSRPYFTATVCLASLALLFILWKRYRFPKDRSGTGHALTRSDVGSD